MPETNANPSKIQNPKSKLTKGQLRRSLLAQRQALPPEGWRQTSDRLCSHLQTHPLVTQARTILAYFSIRQEPDLSPLFALPHRWGFPRCMDETLSWHCWSPQGSMVLEINRYQIPEPPPDAPQLHADEVDLILVPAVACDRQGYRLGYGGGFYDRLLSSPEWANKPTIGIVFDWAFLPQLPTDPWDRPLQGICTDGGFYLPCPKDSMGQSLGANFK
ncbi:5-formyltetrahydrofolate cyclo-ligase [Egbenema bharatensis]|uniref:5-formyltetrahydrofolate cyclo-ligase n=1 Tax=Egbenema bharatensis TaxID=3463334 RepID=UPI003A845C88